MQMHDGSTVMTAELPPGILPVRFERDLKIQIETDPNAVSTARDRFHCQ